jgi:hypothetical protein
VRALPGGGPHLEDLPEKHLPAVISRDAALQGVGSIALFFGGGGGGHQAHVGQNLGAQIGVGEEGEGGGAERGEGRGGEGEAENRADVQPLLQSAFDVLREGQNQQDAASAGARSAGGGAAGEEEGGDD